jgi:uncharacterized MAPEG superfamily protein
MLPSTTCLMIVALMPFFWTVLAKSTPKYDNVNPRQYLGNLKGWRQRAWHAHLNCWEALALLIAALVTAWHAGVPAARIDELATIFVAARVLHGLFYLANIAVLRTLVWFVGVICVVMLFSAAGAFRF